MSKVSKIIVTIVIIIAFMAIFGIIVGIRGDNWNSTPGIFGLIVFAGMIGAIRAVWKKGDNDKNYNSAMLQK